MKKHILLPTDFSDNAWSAIVYALKLFSDEECTFYLLHASKMRTSQLSITSNSVLKTMADNDLKSLKELKTMAEVSNANANHDFEIILSPKALLEAVEQAIDKHYIDLVVMGTKGSTAAQELFFGSHTVHLLTHIKHCPVLVVPDEYDFVTPHQIAFPTNFSRFFEDQQLKHLKQIIEWHHSKLRVVCILSEDKLTDIQEFNMTKLESAIEHFDYSFHFMPDYAKKTKAINDFISLLDINMLVMVNYKHSFIENIIKEPIIKKIGFHPLVPFLVIPE